MKNYTQRVEILQNNEFVLASIFRRFIAFFIDFFVVMLLFYLADKLLPVFGIHVEQIKFVNLGHVEIEAPEVSPNKIKTLEYCLWLLPVFYYSLMFYFTNGRTIGKFLLGIRVVSVYHHKIGLWHCIERSLGYAASVLELGIGFIQAFWNPNRMALHDKIADTIVVRIKKKKVEEEDSK
jgi:uncharacterized RDD family membrane protein YckC